MLLNMFWRLGCERVWCAWQAAAGEQAARLQNVCIGSEWHRFPSAFFLPSDSYRLAFVDFGFDGMLPTEFDTAAVRRALIRSLPCPAPSALPRFRPLGLPC